VSTSWSPWHAPQGTADQDLWLFDLIRGAIQRRLTFGPELERGPVWVTNDRFLYGASGGSMGVSQQTITGARQPLFDSHGPEIPTSLGSDGRILLYTTIT
jgi:hypothetical protein